MVLAGLYAQGDGPTDINEKGINPNGSAIIEIFKENGPRYNLLNSAIIELFEFIRKENVKHLIQHVVERFGDFFKTVNYVDTFRLLVIKHEQNQENPTDSASSTPTLSVNSLNGSREAEQDEEYFNTEDEESSNPSPVKGADTERKFKPLIVKKEEELLVLPNLKSKAEPVDNSDLKKGEKKDTGKKGKISINLNLTHAREEGEEDANGLKRRKT